MIPITQTIFYGDPLLSGNCLQAAVASIVELPLISVPHFVQISNEHIEDFKYDWLRLLAEWLVEKDLRIRPMSLDARYTDEYYLVTGPSPRGHALPNGLWSLNHAVVYQNGILAHDPHPDATGVLGIDSLYSIRPSLK